MIKFITSPLVRISFSMVMLVISLLLAAEFFGLFPNVKQSGLTQRKFIAETLAVHVAMELGGDSTEKMSEILRTAVLRNKLVQSAAVRSGDGKIIDSYGSHDKFWTLKPEDKSSTTQVQVPLFDGDLRVATTEIRFADLNAEMSLLDKRASFASVLLFVALNGFIAFCFFLKRTLKELDPDAVIPERVRKALDTLAEGLLIINREGMIVFSNSAFARTTGIAATELVGKNSAALQWEADDTGQLPWQRLLEGSEMQSGTTIKLRTGYEQLSTFTVNATPIVARADEIRGALVTFNDITEIEIKNAELRSALVKLEKSQLEITRQNEELEYLATRDPLTGSLNRRSFFAGFDALFEESKQTRTDLTCIMSDIDHFKLVNDNFGHGVGDEVIKYLANVLADHSRPNDLVGRFGGEEFCVVTPSTSITECAQIAENIREAIEKGVGADFYDKLQITASFGVSSIRSGAKKPNDMVEQADQALYHSKENGRNQVAIYSSKMNRAAQTEAPDPTPIIAQPSAPPVPAIKLPEAKPSVPVLAIKETAASDDSAKQDSVATAPDKPPVPIIKPTVPILAISQPPATDPKISEEALESMTNIARLDRGLLLDRLDQAINVAIKKTRHVAILVISIGALQRIKDTLGFVVSEKLYRKTTARLRHILGENDLMRQVGLSEHGYSIARLGDTEICLTLNEVKSTTDVDIIHERILEGFTKTIPADGHEIYVALDTGISVYPLHGTSADILVRHASIAMREARDTVGQNNVIYYSDEINLVSKKRIRLETELHQALFRNELFLCYQPKIDLRTGVIVGMEALIRWKHPELGIVSPGEFIPVAEQTGMIDDISRWVTRVVCAQIAMWHEAGHKDLTVAVNISPIEMRNEALSENILNAIKEFDIPARSLEVEVTESVVMEDMKKAVRTLERLDSHGVRVSIDDFGTGFASLSYLKLFPISKVKIDRSFVSNFANNPDDARIVSGVIAMSHSLGVKVITEGVEEEDQLRFLQDHHCDEVQGNLISLPLQRQEATDFLANPTRVKRFITDYNVADIGLAAVTTTGKNTVITGVLNTFPDSSNDESKTGVRTRSASST